MAGLGYEYPAGAAEDPNAPYNEKICEVCECVIGPYESLNDEGMCQECIDNQDELERETD
tara:strand:+ start:285 stop:464 length:180 start_codon:yes stop_codon:yes gene_type:complete